MNREPTHVLYWVPTYGAGNGGCWVLQTLAAYEAGVVQTDPEWHLEDEPRDIDVNDFTEWIAEMAGYPVTAEKALARIPCWRRFRFRRKESLFYVMPAGAVA